MYDLKEMFMAEMGVTFFVFFTIASNTKLTAEWAHSPDSRVTIGCVGQRNTRGPFY